jgi:hypothetical protein
MTSLPSQNRHACTRNIGGLGCTGGESAGNDVTAEPKQACLHHQKHWGVRVRKGRTAGNDITAEPKQATLPKKQYESLSCVVNHPINSSNTHQGFLPMTHTNPPISSLVLSTHPTCKSNMKEQQYPTKHTSATSIKSSLTPQSLTHN